MKPEEALREPLPRLAVFDLDYTLWPLWVDTHLSSMPKLKGNKVVDSSGEEVAFYPQVCAILQWCMDQDRMLIGAASRTHTPGRATKALELLNVLSLFHVIQIYPGSKLRHFKEIHRKTGIAYKQMIFFDDEMRNREVEELGVTFVWVENGLNWRVWNEGVDSCY